MFINSETTLILMLVLYNYCITSGGSVCQARLTIEKLRNKNTVYVKYCICKNTVYVKIFVIEHLFFRRYAANFGVCKIAIFAHQSISRQAFLPRIIITYTVLLKD